MKWQFWRRNSQPGEQVVSADTWHDTPETFPVEEVFRKSCFNWKRYIVVPLAILSVNLCVLGKMIIESRRMMSNFSNPNYHQYHPFSSVPYLFASIALDLLSIVYITHYMRLDVKRKRSQHNRVQQFVYQNGAKAIPAMLDLLHLRIRGGRTSSLTDSIAYNLKSLLSNVETPSDVQLNESQMSLLNGLLNTEGEYRSGFNRIQDIQLKYFSVMLSPSVIYAVGVLGGENGVEALRHKMEKSNSRKVKNTINRILMKHSPEYQNTPTGRDIGFEEAIFNTTQMKKQFSKRNDNYRWRLGIRWISSLMPFNLLMMALIFTNYVQDPSGHLIKSMIFFMLSYFTLGLVLTIAPYYYNNYQRSQGLKNAILDSSDSIGNFLSIEANLKSYYSQALIFSSLIESTEITQLEPLSRSQLNNLHRLLYPQKIYNLQISSLSHTPLPEIGVIPSILRSLVFLGDKSSLKIIEKFYKSSQNEDYKLVALECMDTLNARLTEKPEQLLRASSLASDALLRASQPAHTTEELLMPMVAEEPIVFAQTEDLDELEVNRQKL